MTGLLATTEQATIQLPSRTRQAVIEIPLEGGVVDLETRTLEFPFSSEEPVERMDWWEWEIYDEILSHDPAHVNMGRIEGRACPLLWNHQRDVVYGVIEGGEVRGRKGYCKARFSRTPEGERLMQEVNDRIITNVSFAYRVYELVLSRDASKKGEKRQYTATNWEIIEVSFVSIPADPTVGPGRSEGVGDTSKNPVIVRGLVDKPIVLPKTEGNVGMEVEERVSEAVKAERDRTAAITAMGEKHGMVELARQMIADGTSIEQARAIVLDKITNRPQESVARPVNPLGLTDQEQRSYSILRAINAAITNDWSQAGFERECHLEIQKQHGREAKGFYIPVRDLKVGNGQRATYAVGASATGGATVETELRPQDFIELLRNRAMVMRLGATMLSGLQGNVAIPRQTAGALTYWVAENGAITQSEATFDQVTLTPKTIAARSQYSRLMLLQSSIDIENFIRQDFAQNIALGIDSATINGTGAGNQPTGLRNIVGVGSVVGGTDGAAPTWAHIVGLETEVAVDNADVGSLAYLANARIRGRLKTTEKATGTATFVWGDGSPDDPGMGMMNGYRAGVSNQLPSNLVKGGSSDCSPIVFGNWRDILIGEWGVLEILPNPYGAGFNSGAVDIRVMQTIDIAVRHPESFALMTDARP